MPYFDVLIRPILNKVYVNFSHERIAFTRRGLCFIKHKDVSEAGQEELTAGYGNPVLVAVQVMQKTKETVVNNCFEEFRATTNELKALVHAQSEQLILILLFSYFCRERVDTLNEKKKKNKDVFT